MLRRDIPWSVRIVAALGSVGMVVAVGLNSWAGRWQVKDTRVRVIALGEGVEGFALRAESVSTGTCHCCIRCLCDTNRLGGRLFSWTCSVLREAVGCLVAIRSHD